MFDVLAVSAAPDFTTLTGEIDFGSTIDLLLSVSASVVGLTLVILGVRKVMGLIRGTGGTLYSGDNWDEYRDGTGDENYMDDWRKSQSRIHNDN